jgi:hypothetical protein
MEIRARCLVFIAAFCRGTVPTDPPRRRGVCGAHAGKGAGIGQHLERFSGAMLGATYFFSRARGSCWWENRSKSEEEDHG